MITGGRYPSASQELLLGGIAKIGNYGENAISPHAV
jgi:hypothetical protein